MNCTSNLISTPNASHANLELLSFIAGNQFDYQTDLFNSILTEPAVIEHVVTEPVLGQPLAQIASSSNSIESVPSKQYT